MIPYEEALSIVLAHASPLGTERLGLESLLGHVLAEPVLSSDDLPRFDNSAVDGFGVILKDVEGATAEQPASLSLLGTIRAGDPPDIDILPGSTIKILTGAPVPNGVETIIMQEYSNLLDGKVYFSRSAKRGENIRHQGEEFRHGDEVLSAGIKVTPPVTGMLANLGYSSFQVYRKPAIAVIVTGNELVTPGRKLYPGQIYESNSYALGAALKAFGTTPYVMSWAGDDKTSLHTELSYALDRADLVITTGGVSVGEYDLVKDIFADLHVEPHFWEVAIKPGKPVYFGSLPASSPSSSTIPQWRKGFQSKKLIFGLPGNPVAMLLTFQLLVKPALMKILGMQSSESFNARAKLTRDLKKKPGRLEFVRGVASLKEEEMLVTPAIGQGSHMLGGLSKANCLIHFPSESNYLTEGEKVDITFLRWDDP